MDAQLTPIMSITIESYITYLFYFQHNTKVYHWTTRSYARHKASDEFLVAFGELVDQFVETWSGKYGRPDFSDKRRSIKLGQWSDDEAHLKLREFEDVLVTQLPRLLSDSDTDLANIRDEMLGLVKKTMYLYTLS
jgi:hypothetical protein